MNKACSVSDCQRLSVSRGWCNIHYQRWLKWGDPLIVKRGGSPDQQTWSIEQRREFFDKLYGQGSFQKLLDHFNNQGCKTLQDIADQFGVTRERVRQWRVRLLPYHPEWIRSGYRRRTIACTLPKGIQRAMERGEKSDWLGSAFQALRQRGLSPKFYLCKSKTNIMHAHSRVFYLNGFRCLARFAPSYYKIKSRYYIHFNYDHSSPLSDFVICFAEPEWETIYVIPAEVLRSLKQFKKQKRFGFFIQREYKNFGYKNHFPTVDWRQYKEAWGLLERNKKVQNLLDKRAAIGIS